MIRGTYHLTVIAKKRSFAARSTASVSSSLKLKEIAHVQAAGHTVLAISTIQTNSSKGSPPQFIFTTNPICLSVLPKCSRNTLTAVACDSSKLCPTIYGSFNESPSGEIRLSDDRPGACLPKQWPRRENTFGSGIRL